MSEPDYKGFAVSIMQGWPDYGDLDGFTLQDLAERHGILELTTRTTFCDDPQKDYGEFGSNCGCREFYTEASAADGFECYRIHASMLAARQEDGEP